MGFLGDTSKGILLLAVVVGVFLIFEFIAMNQIAIAILILVSLIIPLSLVALEYRKNFRGFECRKCNHNFKVSYLRLLFTRKFRGKDPVPTGTAAYNLECPKCGDKAWLVPLEQERKRETDHTSALFAESGGIYGHLYLKFEIVLKCDFIQVIFSKTGNSRKN